MWDTHLHLDLLGDLLCDERALDDAVTAGVTVMTGIGTDPRKKPVPTHTPPASLRIGYARGLHPQELPKLNDDDVEACFDALRDCLNDDDTIAIGECGLDARRGIGDDDTARARQRDVFSRHLTLANKSGLPVVIHGVRRDGDVLAMLDAHGPLPGAVWHGFSGSADTAREAVKRGVVISIGFMILDDKARRVREAIALIPETSLVIETDAPPLAPARLRDVAVEVARLRNDSVEHIVEVTTNNAARLFPKMRMS